MAKLLVLIIVLLGGLAAILLRSWRRPFVVRAVVAALLATLVWVGGTYLLLAATAPNELGPPLPSVLLVTFLTTLAAALLTGWVIHSRGMYQLVVSLVAVSVIVVIAGSWQVPTFPADEVRIEVEDILDARDTQCVRLLLTFGGEKWVKLYEEKNRESALVHPDRETGIATCSILLFADAFQSPSGPRVKWLHQIKGGGITAGGPAILPASESESLDDYLDIGIEPGTYRIGQEIPVAQFQGNSLILLVEQPSDPM